MIFVRGANFGSLLSLTPPASWEDRRLAEWYESFFDGLATGVWRTLVPAEASDAQAAFLVGQLGGGSDGARRLLDEVGAGRCRITARRT